MENIEIPIPADNDGFALLQCQRCLEYFKLKPGEIESDEVIEIWCPYCGLTSESYLTEEVIELAIKISKNIAMSMIANEAKKWERQFKGSGISFKLGNVSQQEEDTPLVAGIDSLEIQKYNCCKKSAKIKPLIKMCGTYCPYCGVMYDEFK